MRRRTYRQSIEPGAAPDPTAEIVTVAVYDSLLEADLVRSELEMAGIEAWVGNATVAQTLISMQETGITVQVNASDAAQAEEIISGRADIAENADTVTDEGVVPSSTAPAMYDDAESGG